MRASIWPRTAGALLLSVAVLTSVPASAAEQASGVGDIEALQKENAELRARCEALEAKLALLEAKQPTVGTKPQPLLKVANASNADKADSAKTPSPAAGQKLDLNDFLVQMDAFADSYKKAETSVLKDDVFKAMLNKAESLVTEKTLPEVTAKVKDVQKSQDGLTTVSFVEMRMVGLEKTEYLRRGQPLLSVSTMPSSVTLVLKMSPEDARKLKPGQQVQLIGTPSFKARDWGMTPAGTVLVLHFTIKGMHQYDGGSIFMNTFECRIGTTTYAVK